METFVTSRESPGRLSSYDIAPPAVSPGHVLVRVRATSINHGEMQLMISRPNGWAPGQDVAGTIERQAPEGGPPAGSRVVGLAEGAAWGEFVSVPLEHIAQLPDDVAYETAACLPVGGLTALRALRALGDVVTRELLVTGANGGVGNITVQLARNAGAIVTALVRRAESSDDVRFVTALDDTMHFERVIDGVGGEVLAEALLHLRPHAKLVCHAGGDPTPIALSTMKGSPATIEFLVTYLSPGQTSEDIATLVGLVSTGRLRPLVDRVFRMQDVNIALEAQRAGGISGKLVLTRAG